MRATSEDILLKYRYNRWGIRPFRPWLLAITAIALVFVLENTSEAKQKYTIIYVSKEDHDSKNQFSQKLEVLKVMRKSSKSVYKTMIFSPKEEKLAASFFEFASKYSSKQDDKAAPQDFTLVNGKRYFFNIHRSGDGGYLDSIEILSDKYKPIIISTVSEVTPGHHKLSRKKYKRYLRIATKVKSKYLETFYVLPDLSLKYNIMRISNLDDLRPAFIDFLKSHGFSLLDLETVKKSYLRRVSGFTGKNRFVYKMKGEIRELVPPNAAGLFINIAPIVRFIDSFEEFYQERRRTESHCEDDFDSAAKTIRIYKYSIVGDYLYLLVRFTFGFFDWERGSSCEPSIKKNSLDRIIYLKHKDLPEKKKLISTDWITIDRKIVDGCDSF